MVSFYAITTSNRLSVTAQQALLLEVLCDNLDGTLDVTLVRLDVDLGARRGLVRRGDTGEFYHRTTSVTVRLQAEEKSPRLTLDLPRPRLLIQPLRIPLLHHTQRRIHKHLDKRDRRVMRLVQLSRELSVRDVGRDEGSQGDTCRCREEQRHFADSTDVFFSVFGAESEVLPGLEACVSTREERIDQGVTHLVQTESDVIAVKSERMQLLVQKVLLQRRSDRGLRIHRQPGSHGSDHSGVPFHWR